MMIDTRTGSSTTSRPGVSGCSPTGGSFPPISASTARSAAPAAAKWYGGVYGWGFTVINPADKRPAHRNDHFLGLNGFGNAYFLTGDDRFLDAWRKQIDAVNSHARVENGQTLYPHMFGDQGWYDYRPEPTSTACSSSTTGR